jgi:hypothetical protein
LLPDGTKSAIVAYDWVETLELHNNVFYRPGGRAVQVVRDPEAIWASGAARTSGAKDWAPTGSTGIPAGVTGTVTGAVQRASGWGDVTVVHEEP